MKIEIKQSDNNTILLIDGIEKSIEEISGELLENIVNKSLDDDVDFIIEGESPLALFFKEIQNQTSTDSDLRKELEKIEKERKQVINDNTQIEETFLMEVSNESN